MGTVQCELGRPSGFELAVDVERLRCLFVVTLGRCLAAARAGHDGLSSARAMLQHACQEVASAASKDSPQIKALLEDMTGQALEAFSREDWCEKWGVHYLPSVLFANQRQVCNNFKDPGVQFYGGDLFQ